jgi:hypothetical protein
MLIAALVVLPVGTADAKRHHHKRGHAHARRHAPKPKPPVPVAPKPASFDGTCEFSGAVTFTPPMTSTPQPTRQHANAPGTCTGTYVDHAGASHALDAAPVTYTAESGGDAVSCAFGMASGTGSLVFGDGNLAFTMNEYRVAATPLIHLGGQAGGEAWMPVTPSQSSDPTAAVQACNAGGLEQFDLDAHLRTNGPIRG